MTNFSPYLGRPVPCNSSWMMDTQFPCYLAAPSLKPPSAAAAPLHRRRTPFCPHRSSEQAGHMGRKCPPPHLWPACLPYLEGRICPMCSPWHVRLCTWCPQALLSSTWRQLDSLRLTSGVYVWTQIVTPLPGNLHLQHVRQEEFDGI